MYFLCIGASKRLGFREINRRTLVLKEGEWLENVSTNKEEKATEIR